MKIRSGFVSNSSSSSFIASGCNTGMSAKDLAIKLNLFDSSEGIDLLDEEEFLYIIGEKGYRTAISENGISIFFGFPFEEGFEEFDSFEDDCDENIPFCRLEEMKEACERLQYQLQIRKPVVFHIFMNGEY